LWLSNEEDNYQTKIRVERGLAYMYSKGPVEVGAAELSGYLDGISYLNRERRSFFAGSFLLSSVSEDAIIQDISARFQENPLPPLVVYEEREITTGEMEHDLGSSVLCNSYMADSGQERDLRAYISFKIMDRIDEFLDLDRVKMVKKLTGSFGSEDGTVTFFCLTTSSHTLVIYLHAMTGKASQ
jgi:hypothetical protein